MNAIKTNTSTHSHFFPFLLHSCWHGGWRYRVWMLFLVCVMGVGIEGYGEQLHVGLGVTGMSDQIVWGLYIGNFTFLVGVAAAAVVLMVPAFLFHRPWMERVIPMGECMALTAVVMSLMFVLVDLGQPLRIWHALPFIGSLHFPTSILAWDMVVLGGYLILNATFLFQNLYRGFYGRVTPTKRLLPWMVLAIFTGLGIHTVTAFMFSGIPARPFWHTGILAPRFIASAFVSGAGLLILIFSIMTTLMKYRISSKVIRDLSLTMAFSMVINLFLWASEQFVHLYPKLSLGLSETNTLTVWIKMALLANCVAAILLVVHPWRQNLLVLRVACLLAVVGIGFEKGVGLVVPGFIPTTLGEVVQYIPTPVEIQVTLGIWAVGLFLFTLLSRVVVFVTRDEHII